MQLHELKRTHPNKTKLRVGRGGNRGKTAGRGHKGQNARAGTSGRPQERDMIKKIPKLRGHGKNRGRTVNPDKERAQTVTLAYLERVYEAGDTVTPRSLLALGAVSRFSGRTPQVKILATGALTKKLNVQGCVLSAGAQSAVERAGGSVME